eukprot:NODE_2355_length_2229_cov_10.912464.p1 GENE.NODE_2355_length_2229_cov_10.912464~~NODE_2355_length_2229_cov_10.912464.p1  ORF type:complete len:547 (-),score=150.82 NODE_2355_length_2229_cov_10.912464:377-2017(-)
MVCVASASRLEPEPMAFLSVLVPVGVLASYVVVPPTDASTWDALQLAVVGFVPAIIPYRALVHKTGRNAAAGCLYEASLLVCPLLLFALVRLRGPLKPEDGSAWALLAAALVLALLEWLSPIALTALTGGAFALAWRHSSPVGMAAAVAVWELRGGLSASGDVDRVLLPEAVHALLIGVVALILALVGAERADAPALLLALFPAVALVAPLTNGFLCLVIAVSAVTYAALRPHWLTEVLAPLIVVSATSTLFDCLTLYGRGDGACWLPVLDMSRDGQVAGSISALVLVLWLLGFGGHSPRDHAAIAAASVTGLLLALMGSWSGGIFSWLPLLEVALVTAALVVWRPPLLHVWYLLPGLWVAATGCFDHEAGSDANAVALPVGVALVALPWLTEWKEAPALPDWAAIALGSTAAIQGPGIEPIGCAWVAGGAVIGLYPQGVLGEVTAILILAATGGAQLLAGLSIHKGDAWRRAVGMLGISSAVFLAAFATHGLVRGILVLAGSLSAIASAVLVFFFRNTEEAEGAVRAVDRNECLRMLNSPREHSP